MERMREHVFNEADLNHDGLIRYANQNLHIPNLECIIKIVKIVLLAFLFITVMKSFWNKQKSPILRKMRDGKGWMSNRFILNRSTKLMRGAGRKRSRKWSPKEW